MCHHSLDVCIVSSVSYFVYSIADIFFFSFHRLFSFIHLKISLVFGVGKFIFSILQGTYAKVINYIILLIKIMVMVLNYIQNIKMYIQKYNLTAIITKFLHI